MVLKDHNRFHEIMAGEEAVKTEATEHDTEVSFGKKEKEQGEHSKRPTEVGMSTYIKSA